MQRPIMVLGLGLGAGAALMYWLDPDRGRRRRALAEDKLSHVTRVERELVAKALRDLDHRRQGLLYRARSIFRTQDAADEVVAERIRAMLGRYSSHPRSLEVRVASGIATLSGLSLAREVDDLLAAVRKVPGVHRVDDAIERHEQPGKIPSLQGQGLHVPRKRRAFRGGWMPAARLVAGSLGVSAAIAGTIRRGGVGAALFAGGAVLAARALTNKPLRALFSQTHDGSGEIRLEKALRIDAPVTTVYSYFRNFENFARFMDHVEEVHAENAHSTWKVRGPAGRTIGFEVEITRDQPNRLLAWQSRPNPGFEHSGTARFSASPDGGTNLVVDLSYSVAGGEVGNWLASRFRADPKRVLDEELLRFKSLLENGKTHAHRQPVTREDLQPA